MEDVIIVSDFSGKGYEFAKGIYDYLVQKKERCFPVRMNNLERTTFSDGETKLRLADNIRRSKCFLIHDSNNEPSKWFTELAFTLNAMTFSSPEEINVVLPYMRFARQDRKECSRVSVNAKVVAELVSSYSRDSSAHFRGMTLDLHAPQVQEYFSIPFDNLYSGPTLITYLQKNHSYLLENLTVVSPDLGGGKRVRNFVKRLKEIGIDARVALGDKVRKKDNEVDEMIIIGDVKERNCLVLDDIIDTGGTLLLANKSLLQLGAKKVYVYGSHGVFSKGVSRFGDIEKILVGNTLETPKLENIEIVNMSNLFGEAIYRTIAGESLATLFDGVK